MAIIPVLGVKLPRFHRGAAFEFGPITFTIGVGIPDPNDWDSFKLMIYPETGQAVESDPNDALIPPDIDGTGPWTIVAYFPITAVQSASLPAAPNTRYRFPFTAGAYRDVLAEDTVPVLEMTW